MLREKIADTIRNGIWDAAGSEEITDAILSLLSDPANISDEMILAMIAHYEMMSFDPPAPNVAHVRAVGMFAEAPALKERFRESFAAAFTAKESETK